MVDQAEKALEEYLETTNYEETQDALFHGLRLAFLAGWEAANKSKSKNKQTPIQNEKSSSKTIL